MGLSADFNFDCALMEFDEAAADAARDDDHQVGGIPFLEFGERDRHDSWMSRFLAFNCRHDVAPLQLRLVRRPAFFDLFDE